MNTKLYVLIGPPGSGKSTFASRLNNVKIISSDNYREKLLNDVNNQSNNSLIFDTMLRDCKMYLEKGVSCVYDATNMTVRDRSRVLNLDVPNVKKIAVVFDTTRSECKRRNSLRSRVVPDEVIDRMFSRFQEPTYAEGFDSIIHYN